MKKETKLFDIKAFDIKFQSIFIKKEIGDYFFEFLKKEFNTEPFLCIKEIDELSTLKTNKELIEKIKFIKNNFIIEEAPQEINASGFIKKELIQIIDKQIEMDDWILEESPFEIFYPIRKLLYCELAHDNFPRFIRETKTEEIYSKYKSDPDIMVYRTSIQFPYQNKNFEQSMITDSDFYFSETLLADSYDWDLFLNVKEPNVKIYNANVDFLPYSSFFKGSYCFKVDGLMKLNIESMICTLLSQKSRNELTANAPVSMGRGECYTSKELKLMYPDEKMTEERISAISYISLNGLFPISSRYAKTVESVRYDHGTESIYYLQKSVIPDEFHGKEVDWSKKHKFQSLVKGEMKQVEGYMIATMHYIHLQKIDNFTTKMKQIKSKQISKFNLT
jgi:hypothetical protein